MALPRVKGKMQGAMPTIKRFGSGSDTILPGRQRMIKGILWAILDKIGTVVLGFATYALLARHLAPEEMGVDFSLIV